MQHKSVPNSDGLMQFLAPLAFSLLFAAIQSNDNVPIENSCPVSSADGDGTGCEIISCPESDIIMNCPDEHTLEQGYPLGTFPRLGKWWKISLEFKPERNPHRTEMSNIIKLSGDSTQTRKHSNDTGIPTRIGPGGAGIFSIWTLPDQDLHFSGKHGDEKWNKKYNGTTQLGSWTTISFSQQSQESENRDCLKYRQVIKVNNTELSRKTNKAPQDFHYVEVYASARSKRSQQGVIRNFVLENEGHSYGTSKN